MGLISMGGSRVAEQRGGAKNKLRPLMERRHAMPKEALEAVMNSVRNGLEMRETKITRELSRPWNPHSYAIFAQVHNTL